MTAAPFHVDEWSTLYRDRAEVVLADLEAASVDAIITDPPYSSGGFTRGDRVMDVHTKYVNSAQNRGRTGSGALEAFTGDNRDQRGFGYWCALWLGEAMRVVKPGGIAALFTDWRQLPMLSDVLQASGFLWRGILPWSKPNGRRVQGRFGNTCEYVVWGTNGPRALDTLGSVALPGFFQCSSPRERDHITQKPVEVMRQLCRIVPEGGVVLDPFMGAGTTGVGAILEGRRFVGVELTEHYAEVARRRVVEAAQGAASSGVQDSMFGDLEPVPVAVDPGEVEP
jgi:site-specific DNA-methyltransferase (adenine-specific)